MADFVLSAFADEVSSDLSEQINALKANGIHYIEPRNIGGGLLDKSEEELQVIRKTLDAAGIAVSSLGSPIGKYDITADFAPYLETFEKALRVCKILGTTRMRIFSFYVPQNEPETVREEVLSRLQMLLARAKQCGITLCHENEALIYGQNPPQVSELLTALPDLRGIYDGGNFVMCHQNPLDGFRATLPSLAYLHVKDALSKEQMMVPVGNGEGRYDEVLKTVGETLSGIITLTLEPHLFTFQAYKEIDKHEMRVGMQFSSAAEAFACAANALKALLSSIGYTEDSDAVFRKHT